MRDPYHKKQRDLRRNARSAQRPSIFKLFDVYHPEYKEYDKSYHSGDWQIHSNAQWAWVSRLSGGCGSGMGGVPAWFRRDRNRQLRTQQKAALNRAFREDAWDDFMLPESHHDIRWLWW